MSRRMHAGERTSRLSYANSNSRKKAPIRKATQSETMRSLDKRQARPSALNLDPAAEDAALAALERKREELRPEILPNACAALSASYRGCPRL
jgi:hypothetical protein